MDVVINNLGMPRLHVPENIWLELHDDNESCDVLVRTEDGIVYTALFVTLNHLQGQMELNYRFTEESSLSPAVRYAAIDTQYILVENLSREVIEDTIDNLIEQDIFDCMFVRVTELDNESGRTISDCKRATQEVAAVVISDVLRVQ